MAHCDLQHGNVLLVPGSKAGTLGVKLIDYDGMCVPALALLKSIEVGHPAYQHPQRLREGTYSLEVDRFSHLVIYTALRGLAVGGRSLWEKYDNGDNLLFKSADFEAPEKSEVFAELLKVNDPALRKVVEQLAESARQPLDRVPLLADLVQESPAVTVPAAAPTRTAPAETALASLTEADASRSARRRPPGWGQGSCPSGPGRQGEWPCWRWSSLGSCWPLAARHRRQRRTLRRLLRQTPAPPLRFRRSRSRRSLSRRSRAGVRQSRSPSLESRPERENDPGRRR